MAHPVVASVLNHGEHGREPRNWWTRFTSKYKSVFSVRVGVLCGAAFCAALLVVAARVGAQLPNTPDDRHAGLQWRAARIGGPVPDPAAARRSGPFSVSVDLLRRAEQHADAGARDPATARVPAAR